MKRLVSVLLVVMLLGTQLVFAEERLSGGDPAYVPTFEELTNISAENVEKISIHYNKGERIPADTASPLLISNIVNAFKDIKFKAELTEGGGSGGWLYFINFYMKDGTYIQYGTSLRIDGITYRALDYDDSIEKMAYYHDLMKGVDSSDWAKDYILESMELGLLEGISELNYKEPITRERFCEIVYNMYAKSTDSPTSWNINMPMIFFDCHNSKVAVLYLEGIISGKGDGIFAPNDYLTREEAATIIVRVVNKFMPMPVTEMYFEYDDMSEVSEWASDSVQIISNLGIMNGVGDNKFAPKDTYTAEQAITSIVRLYHRNFNGNSQE